MQTDIHSQLVNGYRGGGSVAYLDFFSNQDWITSTGEIIKGDEKNQYETIECVVTGDVLAIPTITTIPTTTDSPDEPGAVWTAKIRKSGRSKYNTWMAGFKIPHTKINPSWADIRLYNNPPKPQPPPPAISYDAVVLLIREMINAISGNVIASGTGTLAVAQPATISSAIVAADSPIEVISLSNDITGRLFGFDRIPADSFKVASDNFADTGLFAWFIRAI